MKKDVRIWLTILIFLIGISFIIVGCLRQEHLIVMKKAILICLECMGIG